MQPKLLLSERQQVSPQETPEVSHRRPTALPKAAKLPAEALRLHFQQESAERFRQTGLPAPLLQRAEELSGVSLENVRVHYRSGQPERLGALAFAQGDHIFLGPGQEKHIGHELGHVIQQKRGLVRPEFSRNGVAVNAAPALEREADHWDPLLSPLLFHGGAAASGAPALAEPDTAQLLEIAQCWWPWDSAKKWGGKFLGYAKENRSLKGIVKTTSWSLLNVAFASINALLRQLNIASQYSAELGLAIGGICTDLLNAVGLGIRMQENSGSPEEQRVGWLTWAGMILSLFSDLCVNILSSVAGGLGMGNAQSEGAANINDYGAGAVAVVADAFGLASAWVLCGKFRQLHKVGASNRALDDGFASLIDLVGQTLALLNGIPGLKPGMNIAALAVFAFEILHRLTRLLMTWFQSETFSLADGGLPPRQEEQPDADGSSSGPTSHPISEGADLSSPENAMA